MQTHELGDRSLKSTSSRNTDFVPPSQLPCWFQIFTPALARRSPLGGTADPVVLGRDKHGACPAVTFPEKVPCEVSPPVRTADGENRRKRNEHLKPLVNPLSERSRSHAFNSGEVYDDQGELEVQLCSRRRLERAFHGC